MDLPVIVFALAVLVAAQFVVTVATIVFVSRIARMLRAPPSRSNGHTSWEEITGVHHLKRAEKFIERAEQQHAAAGG